jgi:predicted CXXCH cytochrome family protein
MAAPRRTQKQISERYKANLGYYRKRHPWRRARFWTSFLALAAGIAGIVAFEKRGRETFFNPGPISSSHARFADDCKQCHSAAISETKLTPAQFNAVLRERFRHGLAFEPIDRNCEACHLREERRTHTFHEANVVQNRSCSACHQEHRGPGPLKLVASSNCVSCHGKAGIMEATFAGRISATPAFAATGRV